MWFTSVGHHKNSHRHGRSDWRVVERRDRHYQMILENIENWMKWQAGQRQQLVLLKKKQTGIHIYLMEKVHVNLCLSLPGIVIYKVNNQNFSPSCILSLNTDTHTNVRLWDSTCNVLLKNNFGSFEEVLSDDKHLLSSSHWAAVEALLQDLWHSGWLGWTNDGVKEWKLT